MCTGFHFDTEEGNRLLPGFLDSIIGIRAGESKSFTLVFPESWKQESLRGQRAQFTVSSSSYTKMKRKMIQEIIFGKANRVCFLQVDCKELFYRDLPTLDDSLADKLLPGCTTLKEVMNTWILFSTTYTKKFVFSQCNSLMKQVNRLKKLWLKDVKRWSRKPRSKQQTTPSLTRFERSSSNSIYHLKQ